MKKRLALSGRLLHSSRGQAIASLPRRNLDLGLQFREWEQHEAALVHAGMGDLRMRQIHPTILIKEDQYTRLRGPQRCCARG